MFSLILRERIYHLISVYDGEVISQVLPNYYSEIYIKLDDINSYFAKIRKNRKYDMDNMDKYKKALEELKAIHQGICLKKNALIEVQKHNKSKKAKEKKKV